jgi:hypothetical protein
MSSSNERGTTQIADFPPIGDRPEWKTAGTAWF